MQTVVQNYEDVSVPPDTTTFISSYTDTVQHDGLDNNIHATQILALLLQETIQKIESFHRPSRPQGLLTDPRNPMLGPIFFNDRMQRSESAAHNISNNVYFTDKHYKKHAEDFYYSGFKDKDVPKSKNDCLRKCMREERCRFATYVLTQHVLKTDANLKKYVSPSILKTLLGRERSCLLTGEAVVKVLAVGTEGLAPKNGTAKKTTPNTPLGGGKAGPAAKSAAASVLQYTVEKKNGTKVVRLNDSQMAKEIAAEQEEAGLLESVDIRKAAVRSYRKIASAILTEIIPFAFSGGCIAEKEGAKLVSKAANHQKPAMSELECRKQCLREEGCRVGSPSSGGKGLFEKLRTRRVVVVVGGRAAVGRHLLLL